MQDNRKCARRYDIEFKHNAVALVQSGRSISEVAGDLGVSTWSLRRWVNLNNAGQTPREPATLSSESAEQRELRRLRQQVAYLERQRDILKKALGILSAEMPPNASL
jgi:transposase